MDNKVTKERLNNHLEYDWFKYVLILIVSIVLFIFVFRQINVNRSFEQIQIFASCYEYKSNTFCEDTLAALQAEDDKTVRELSFNPQNPRSSEFTTLLSTQGNITSDLLILGKSYAEGYKGAYLQWSDEIVELCVPEYYREAAQFLVDDNGRRYGLRIDGLKNIGDILNFNPGELPDPIPEGKEGEYDTEFYVLINPDSYNIGKYHKKGKAKESNVQTFKVIKRLIEVYNPQAGA